MGWVTQDGLTSQLGNVPGLMSTTWSYEPAPPTLVYLSALSDPDVDVAARFAGLGCAWTCGAAARTPTRERALRKREKRIFERYEIDTVV